MNTKNRKLSLILLTCSGIVLIAALVIGMICANNHYNKKDNDFASRAVGYGVGANKEMTNGNVAFLSNKNNIATLSFTNKTDKAWEPALKIQGSKQIGETLTPMDEGGICRHDLYTLTNKKQDYQSEFLLYDALRYTIDGKKSDSCIIPPDGKEHIVEIDYSYLEENGIELCSELYIDIDCFVLRFDDSYYKQYK